MSTGIPGDETGQPAVPQQPGSGPGYGGAPPPPPSTGSTGYGAPSASTPSGPTSTGKAATSFDPKSLSTPEWLVIGGAVLYLIALILPWVSVSASDVPGLGDSVNGFSQGLLVFAWLLLLAAAVWLLLRSFGVNLQVSVSRALVALVLTGLALLLTLIKFIDVLSSGSDLEALGVDVGTGIGAYLGLLAALTAVAGAFMLFQSERRGVGSTTA